MGFLAATLAGGVFIYWSCVRLKRVSLRGSTLIVSNYRREVAVPFRDVEGVSGSILLSPEVIWLRCRRPTSFGRTIMFMPRIRLTLGFSHHPFVDQLRALIANSMGLPAAPT